MMDRGKLDKQLFCLKNHITLENIKRDLIWYQHIAPDNLAIYSALGHRYQNKIFG